MAALLSKPARQAILAPDVRWNSLGYKERAVSARTFTEVFKSDRPSAIWSALLTVAKVVVQERERHNSMKFKELTTWLVPAVIFDGPLFEAHVAGDDVSVVPVAHVLVEFDQPNRSNPLRTDQFLIDVVHKDYLQAFRAEVEAGHASLLSVLSQAFGEGRVAFGPKGIGS